MPVQTGARTVMARRLKDSRYSTRATCALGAREGTRGTDRTRRPREPLRSGARRSMRVGGEPPLADPAVDRIGQDERLPG